MLTATETALTGPEKLRIDKFNARMGMDDETAGAMFSLFSHTKPGCDDAAYDLMEVAHGYAPCVTGKTIVSFLKLGLVRSDGTIPKEIKSAIQAAVEQGYLMMRGPESPTLKPDLLGLHYE